MDSIPLVEPGTVNVDIAVSSTMISNGVIEGGVFNDTKFEDNNIWIFNSKANIGGGGEIFLAGTGYSTSTHTGNIIQPGGLPQPTSGTGSGITEIPEPATVLLLSLGGLLLKRRK